MYKVAEKFKSIQGEGVYTGTPMAFIRFVGCSVGKRICQYCDTDFDEMMPWRGGGEFSADDLVEWAYPHTHMCLTGGEPFDQDLLPFFEKFTSGGKMIHIETSGTRPWPWYSMHDESVWLCVSPKPGWLDEMITEANEVKVIVPGLGTQQSLDLLSMNSQIALLDGKTPAHPLARESNFTWPSLQNALDWEAEGKIVFLQPRNAKNDVDKMNLMYVQDLLREYPQLRLSVQMHKILKVQ